MPQPFVLRLPAVGNLPLRPSQRLLQTVHGSLLRSGTAGKDSGRDALCRTPDAAVPPGDGYMACGVQYERKEKAETPEKQIEPATMNHNVNGEPKNVCKKCGKPINDKAKFCPYCGEKIEESSEVEEAKLLS